MGPDPTAVVLILTSAYLHVKISVKVFRVYIGVSLVLEHVCAGGGGNVTFHGIYIYGFPRELLYHWCQLCTYGPP